MATSKVSAPIHGNYHGYYNKRPFVNDARLALLPRSLLDGARVLDVGCNEGQVTCEIGSCRPSTAFHANPLRTDFGKAQHMGAERVIGVDIDDTLVSAAWKHKRSVWSQQGPVHQGYLNGTMTELGSLTNHRKKRQTSLPECEEIATDSRLANYFPASFEHMFGPLPIPASRTSKDATDAFPHNVTFRAADWVKEEIPEDTEGYDVVVAFSISKWIHLNSGDEGLKTFFRRVHQVLRPGGTFVLEPQEWDTYNKAKRMNARLKENAKHLKLRPEQFERVLGEIGFEPAEHLGATGEGGFRRPIDLYVKIRRQSSV